MQSVILWGEGVSESESAGTTHVRRDLTKSTARSSSCTVSVQRLATGGCHHTHNIIAIHHHRNQHPMSTGTTTTVILTTTTITITVITANTSSPHHRHHHHHYHIWHRDIKLENILKQVVYSGSMGKGWLWRQ